MHELVAHSVNRSKVRGIRRVVLEFLAKLEYLVIYRAGRRIEVVPPHIIQQFFPGKYPFRVFKEEAQQLEFVRGHGNQLAGAAYLHPCEIDGNVAER